MYLYMYLFTIDTVRFSWKNQSQSSPRYPNVQFYHLDIITYITNHHRSGTKNKEVGIATSQVNDSNRARKMHNHHRSDVVRIKFSTTELKQLDNMYSLIPN